MGREVGAVMVGEGIQIVIEEWGTWDSGLGWWVLWWGGRSNVRVYRYSLRLGRSFVTTLFHVVLVSWFCDIVNVSFTALPIVRRLLTWLTYTI